MNPLPQTLCYEPIAINNSMNPLLCWAVPCSLSLFAWSWAVPCSLFLWAWSWAVPCFLSLLGLGLSPVPCLSGLCRGLVFAVSLGLVLGCPLFLVHRGQISSWFPCPVVFGDMHAVPAHLDRCSVLVSSVAPLAVSSLAPHCPCPRLSVAPCWCRALLHLLCRALLHTVPTHV